MAKCPVRLEGLESRVLLSAEVGSLVANPVDENAVIGTSALEVNAAAGGEIHGLKWEDVDGDGVRDPGEPGLAGVTIYLDANNNGKLDLGEQNTVTMADDPLTRGIDETGMYRFTGVVAGTHIVREVVPVGFEQTFPVAGARSVLWDEAVDGDLSNSKLAPTPLTLMGGGNLISGTVGPGAEDDLFTFTIPAGFVLDSITLLDYSSASNSSFLGVDLGGTYDAASNTLAWGYKNFGSGEVGTDLLPAIASSNSNFSGPLTAGTYTFWIDEGTGPESYTLSLNLKAPKLLWDEAVDGDLSNSKLAPTSLTLTEGENLITGTVGPGAEDDLFTFSVPLGLVVDSISLLGYSSVSNSTFLGIDLGGTYDAASNATAWGYNSFGNSEVGTDLLPALSSSNSNFSGPLTAGTYTFWIDEGTGPEAYTLSVNLKAPTLLWDEAVDGDLSNDKLAPTALALAPGENLITGAVGPGAEDDVFVFSVPVGSIVDSITLLDYSSASNSSFLGIDVGTTYTSVSNNDTYGFTTFGSSQIGLNILPLIGASNDHFLPPLTAGTYTFWIDEGTGPESYALSINLRQPTTLWDEAVDGDLSNDKLSPTALTLLPGLNLITGAAGPGVEDDLFRVVVPSGAVLESITVLDHSSTTNSMFLGMDDGATYTAATNPAAYGFITFSGSNIGENLLPALSASNGNFVTPLTAGTYTFWLDEGTGPESYTLQLNLSTPTNLWDEAEDGDLSNNKLAPTPLILAQGPNIINGSVGPGAEDDVFTVTVQEGAVLGSIIVIDHSSNTNSSFLGMDDGPTYSAATNPAAYGFTTFSGSNIGVDLLAALATSNGNFTGALPAGTYTFWIDEGTGPEDYSLRFNVAATTAPTVTPTNPISTPAMPVRPGTIPDENFWFVTVVPGAVVDGVDFGNREIDFPPRVTLFERNDGQFVPNELTALSFTFSENVGANADIGDLTLMRDGDVTPVNLTGATFMYLGGSNTARWDLSALSLAAGTYTATLHAAGITDATGNPLDGNGDGTGGDDYETTIILAGPGDLNGDGFVGIADLNIVLGSWNQNVTAGVWALGDPTGDGFVGIGDLNEVLSNWNAGTPPVATAAATSASESAARESVTASIESAGEEPIRRSQRQRHEIGRRQRIDVDVTSRAAVAAWYTPGYAHRTTASGYVPRSLQQEEDSVGLGLWEEYSE
jgi:hypothetical protein